jgi:hypothetical protein
MSTHRISACPFCASPLAGIEELDAEAWAVVCSLCGGIGPVAQDRDDAVHRWNERRMLVHSLELARKGR